VSSAFERGEDGTFRCSAFDEFSWQRHGFGTRSANPLVHITLRQVHSDIVLNARGLQDRQREGDALVTDEAGRAVGIRTADCVPILLLDQSNRAVSAVHAGWRGTAAQIISRTIQKLRNDFGSNPGDILAAIGPCIRQCCYEVGPEVAARFSETYLRKSVHDDKWNLDLAAANCNQMLESGIPAGNIFDLGACTVCRAQEFFSYRREPENPGRMISSIQRIA
jgi:YfiH family protein